MTFSSRATYVIKRINEITSGSIFCPYFPLRPRHQKNIQRKKRRMKSKRMEVTTFTPIYLRMCRFSFKNLASLRIRGIRLWPNLGR